MNTLSFLLGLVALPAVAGLVMGAYFVARCAEQWTTRARGAVARNITWGIEVLRVDADGNPLPSRRTVGRPRARLAARIALAGELRAVGKHWVLIRTSDECTDTEAISRLEEVIAETDAPADEEGK